MYYYEVAPTKIIRGGSDSFTYHSATTLSIGAIVVVPVGKSHYTGVVVRQTSKPSYSTKEILSSLYPQPLPGPLLATLLWISEYYATPLATTLQTALPRGINKKRRERKKTASRSVRNRTHFLLNNYQAAALDTLKTTEPGTIILHGVTGSGKTAIYREYAKYLIETGRSVLVIVPEIALTSQLVAEFQHEFPDLILTHSNQTESERHGAWEEALTSTSPRLIIGPRSALFMPLANIGAIIIDEAHEPSLKQDQSPKYSALRVASILAKQHQATVIQGTATPLISEYYLAQAANRPIIELPVRAQTNASDAHITILDMTKRGAFSHHRFFSDDLLTSIQENLADKKQVLLFHNRRGSASSTLCENCGWSAICPRCFVPYTLHADRHVLRCHICDTAEHVPTSCPVCSSTDIIHKGIGTKLVESELRRLFPHATIARFDADTDQKETVDRRYQELYDGAIDIIIGTQVIAKGLDLPHLRTVGIIQADAGLSLPDYSSSERTFQLLAQAVGRVGRSHHATKVIVQTYQPDAPAVKYGISQDYAQFYKETLMLRKRGHFPPFTYLLKLTCAYKTEATAIRHSKELAAHLKQKYPTLTIFGPTPAFYERQRDTYRWQITVKSPKRSLLTDILRNDLPSAGWLFDVDPTTLL